MFSYNKLTLQCVSDKHKWTDPKKHFFNLLGNGHNSQMAHMDTFQLLPLNSPSDCFCLFALRGLPLADLGVLSFPFLQPSLWHRTILQSTTTATTSSLFHFHPWVCLGKSGAQCVASQTRPSPFQFVCTSEDRVHPSYQSLPVHRWAAEGISFSSPFFSPEELTGQGNSRWVHRIRMGHFW